MIVVFYLHGLDRAGDLGTTKGGQCFGAFLMERF